MKAILLAAGFGTRLRPLTDQMPKCLVPIGGEALLGIWLRRLSAAGIGPYLVNTHYLADKVQAYLAASSYAKLVAISHEPVLLGTAGTLLHNLDFFGNTDGLLIHADNWCLADFGRFVEAHRRRPAECLMTMMTFRSETPSTCGIVETDKNGVVRGFHEKVASPPGNQANGAVYLLAPELQHLLRGQFASADDFSTQVLPLLVGRILAHETTEPFLDIGTPASYAKACELAAQQI